MIRKATRRVDILRNLKLKLDRRSLEKLYTSFIRPLLEYRDIVWGNCTKEESERLEKVQQLAMRVITGAKKGTSRTIQRSWISKTD